MPNSEKYVELSSKFFKRGAALSLSLFRNSHPTNPKISGLQKVEQLDMYKGVMGILRKEQNMIQLYDFLENEWTHLVFLDVKNLVFLIPLNVVQCCPLYWHFYSQNVEYCCIIKRNWSTKPDYGVKCHENTYLVHYNLKKTSVGKIRRVYQSKAVNQLTLNIFATSLLINFTIFRSFYCN